MSERTFNHSRRFVQGWYWALPSRDLGWGQAVPLRLMGRDLALYRTLDGRAIALDAVCPHMGALLSQGRVAGDRLLCPLHRWAFDPQGRCAHIPAQPGVESPGVRSWPTAERYGLIWIWTGEGPPLPLPYAPELRDEPCDARVGPAFHKNCHPNVLLINAIDAHHFNSVHNLPLDIVFRTEGLADGAIAFHNTTRGGDESWLIRLIRRFYREAVTYSLCYWYGSSGTVTLGPDFLHFYILFALRPTEAGHTEGRTILLTRRRSRWWGKAFNQLVLGLTQQVGNYFAKGDTQVFQTIQFDFQTPLQADRSILEFVQHVEQQPALHWQTWQPVETSPAVIPASAPAPGAIAEVRQGVTP